jgi:hypothetical protein
MVYLARIAYTLPDTDPAELTRFADADAVEKHPVLTLWLGFAWPRFAMARFWLAACGHLPWRLMRFLDDAHRRGVLRQVGAEYQFRHARLQDHLAA